MILATATLPARTTLVPGITFTVIDPVAPFTVPVILADPSLSATTRPLRGSTRATSGALDVHVIAPSLALGSDPSRARKDALSPTRIGLSAAIVSFVAVAALESTAATAVDSAGAAGWVSGKAVGGAACARDEV